MIEQEVEFAGFEQSADAGQAERGESGFGSEAAPHQGLRFPFVAVPAAAASPGNGPQPGGGEVGQVTLTGLRVGVRVQQGATILGDEGEQQPVHHPQQTVVDVGDGDRAVREIAA